MINSGFTYSGIDINANNARLESKIREKKKQIELGHQPDIYINKSLSIIKGNLEMKNSLVLSIYFLYLYIYLKKAK
jgi:hypothetical protein